MTGGKSYRQAVATLRPDPARMAAIQAQSDALRREAEKQIAAIMAATGKDYRELYREACGARNDGESMLDKEIRVALLGMVRKAAR